MAIRVILVAFVILAALSPIAAASEPVADTLNLVLGALPVGVPARLVPDAVQPTATLVVGTTQAALTPMSEPAARAPATIYAGWGYDGDEHRDARGEASESSDSSHSTSVSHFLSPYAGQRLLVPLTGLVGEIPLIDGDLVGLPLQGPATSAPRATAAVAAIPHSDTETQAAAAPAPLASPVLVAAAAAASAAAPALASPLWERLRRFGIASLYTRIAKERLLDHAGREKLLATVRAAPGSSVVELASAAQTPRNTATYHLRRLEKEGLAFSEPRGRVRLWFAAGSIVGRQDAPALAALRHDTTRAIAVGIGASPGIDQRTLCAQLGLPPSLAHWHADRLVSAGLVRKERAGRRVLYYPGENFGVVARSV